MKKIVYIFLVLLLSGCTATIDINLDRDKVTETLVITANKDYLENIDENEFVKEFSEFEYGFNNYEKKLVYNSNESISKEYTYTNDYDNYELMSFLNKCYEEVNIERRQDLIVNTSSEFLCYDYFKDLGEVKIKIKSIYKAKEDNADKREGKYYVWTINKDNYLDKKINIIFSNEYDNEDTSSYTIYAILAIIIGIIYFVLTKIKRANSV